MNHIMGLKQTDTWLDLGTGRQYRDTQLT